MRLMKPHVNKKWLLVIPVILKPANRLVNDYLAGITFYFTNTLTIAPKVYGILVGWGGI